VGYFTSVYTSGLPHRARADYMYLHDRVDETVNYDAPNCQDTVSIIRVISFPIHSFMRLLNLWGYA